MRKSIQALLADTNLTTVSITPELIIEWLGNPLFKKTALDTEKAHVGLATGLAWTEVGGDVLEIETSVLPGKGTVTLTGQLGEVMQESAQAALSYIRSRAEELGIKPSFHTSKDIHIHIPEGATPKDGPSAGITICTALISALTHKPSRGDIAMTGEITLRGRVLAIGGLKEKLLAAKQYGLKTVIVPHENESELKDIRKEIVLDGVEIVFAKTMDEVIAVAFKQNPLSPLKPVTKKKKKKSTKKNKTADPATPRLRRAGKKIKKKTKKKNTQIKTKVL
jgi:ATP-dependent Lon protease